MTPHNSAPPAAGPQQFGCPECGDQLQVGTSACPRCGIRLVGPLAQQLWRVDQQISHLSAESRRLRDLLLQPAGPDELSQGVRPSVAAPGHLSAHPPVAGSRPPAAPPRTLSGQQLLLGLAAFLLLSGVAFFLAVVWSLIGVVGQALVMVVLTGIAGGGAVLATRKRLPAAAETAAVIASGLVVLDLSAAHGLGLADLDRFDLSQYWAGAGLLGALVLLGFDRWVPRRDDAGELRRILVYRPVAVGLAATALWSGAYALVPDALPGVGASALALGLVVVSVALVGLGRRLDETDDLFSLSSALPWFSAGWALLLHLGAALSVGYGTAPSGDRLLAALLLLVLPVALLLAQTRPQFAARPALRTWVRLFGLAGVAVALGVPVFGAERLVVALVAAGLGAALVALAVRGHDASAARAWPDQTWGDLLTWVLRAAVAGLFFLLFLLLGGDHASGVDMQAWRAGAGSGQWWLPLLPAAALAVPSAITAVRRGSVPVAALAHLATLAGLFLALRDADALTWATVTLAATVLSVAVAAAARWNRLDGRDVGLEVVALTAGAVHGLAAVVAAVDESSEFVFSAVLVGLGAVLLAYATLPGRLGFAYLGVGALTAALWVQLFDHEVAVEWYAVPPALMLLGIGAVQWARDRGRSTWVTLAPALVVGLFPSLVVGLAGDSLTRLVLVTAVSALVLLGGIAQRWQAPVVLGALALVLVAWTQGGPWLAYVDGWLLLTLSGLVLLVIGIMWERSIMLGRRTFTWLGSMQ